MSANQVLRAAEPSDSGVGHVWQRQRQYFYRDWYEPKDGYYEPPTGPGFGYELDEGKIKSRTEIR